MDFNISSKKTFSLAILLSLGIVLVVFLTSHQKGSMVVFCDVGQGDAAYVRIEDKIDILIDAGPNREVLNCLGRHMPFYDHKIELAFISHPQNDHYGGYKYVVEHYKIDTLVLSPVLNPNKSFPLLLRAMKDKGVIIKELYDGDSITLTSHAQIRYLWPTKQYVVDNVSLGLPKDPQVLGTTTEDLNLFSEIFILSIGKFDTVFTGDSMQENLNKVAHDSGLLDSDVEVLKVPHHGSKNGLSKEFFAAVHPDLSVISAGRNNKFGHPHKIIVDMLKQYQKPFLITANTGDISIHVSDFGWSVEDNK